MMAPSQSVRRFDQSLYRSAHQEAISYYNSNIQRWIAASLIATKIFCPRVTNTESKNTESKNLENDKCKRMSDKTGVLIFLICSAGLLYPFECYHERIFIISNGYINFSFITRHCRTTRYNQCV